eukprot:1596640-Rhodomonas_salina.1
MLSHDDDDDALTRVTVTGTAGLAERPAAARRRCHGVVRAWCQVATGTHCQAGSVSGSDLPGPMAT